MNEELLEEAGFVMEAMKRYGGSFVRNLGVALSNADMENTAIIKASWPKYWAEYLNIGKNHMKER